MIMQKATDLKGASCVDNWRNAAFYINYDTQGGARQGRARLGNGRARLGNGKARQGKDGGG